MNVRLATSLFVLLALGVACGPKDNDDDDGSKPSKSDKGDKADKEPTAAPAPTQAPTATVKIDDGRPPPTAGIEPRVKAELDNRSDGITGTSLTGTGAKATVQAPTNWKLTKGDFSVAASSDEKARVSVGGGDSTKIDAAATAAGLTGCQWGAVETVTVGKDKISAQAADGFCSRGAGQAKAAYMIGEGLLVLGSWDGDGDATSVFGSMRAAAKAATGSGGGDIAACCAALRGNAKSAPPQQVGAYLAAAGACDALKSNPQARAGLGQVRALLVGAGVPASCK